MGNFRSYLYVLVAACVFSNSVALAQFNNMPSVTPQSLCEARCDNRDGDALFPQGTRDLTCVMRCRGISGDAPPSPSVRPSGDNRAFILLEAMNYKVGNSGIVITVPAGFVTDYASIPRPLWSLYSPHDQYSRAAIVHDYLYWTRKCKREQADNLFSIAMKESAVSEITQGIVYSGVDLGGEASWLKNGTESDRGMPRIVPIDRRDFPPNWSWEQYRAKLFSDGYRDPKIEDEGAYCRLGDSQVVPGGLGNNTLPTPKTVLRASK